MKKLVLTILFLTAFSIFMVDKAHACLCVPRPLSKTINDASIVFTGQVIRITSPETGISEIRLKALKRIKGTIESETIVFLRTTDGCQDIVDFDGFNVKKTYIVFAKESESKFWIEMCGGTGNFNNKYLQQIGKAIRRTKS